MKFHFNCLTGLWIRFLNTPCYTNKQLFTNICRSSFYENGASVEKPWWWPILNNIVDLACNVTMKGSFLPFMKLRNTMFGLEGTLTQETNGWSRSKRRTGSSKTIWRGLVRKEYFFHKHEDYRLKLILKISILKAYNEAER